MRIGSDYKFSYINYSKPVKKPTFKNVGILETVGRTHIGNKPNGYIGLIKVLNNEGKDAYLSVFKSTDNYGEIYHLKDTLDRIVGKLDMKINKEYGYERFCYDEDPSHVFVNELKNYSNPDTPYYFKGLDVYRGVGTRLLQLAQKRSFEEGCNGCLELVSKKDALPFYKKLGFIKANEFSVYLNPNKLKLPQNKIIEFSELLGGL